MRLALLRRLGATSVAVMALGACGSETPGDIGAAESALLSSDGQVTATLKMQSDWGAGYCTGVVLANLGKTATTNWTVTVALNGATLGNLWSASGKAEGGNLTASASPHNSVIEGGKVAEFGFCAAGSGRPTILSVTQTGATGAGGGSSGDAGAAGAGNAGAGNAAGAGRAGAGNAGAGNAAGAGGTVGGGTGGTSSGRLTREVWNNAQGTAVSQIPVSKAPTSVGEITLFEAPSNVGDNYGQRLRGYIVAPSTGQYTFWIAGDDGVELWLSTSSDPSKKTRIAYNTTWTSSRQWNKAATQRSAVITLQAGTRYYVEALMKEGSGQDSLAVGWSKPGESTSAPSEVIPGNVLAPYSSSGGGGTGGMGGSGGAGGTGASAGAGATSGAGNAAGYGGIGNGGTPGFATRYWDCCKPHCGWADNSGGDQMKMCTKANALMSDPNAASSCTGGTAYTCWSMAPWAVNDNLAYGYAATPGGDCGKCYQLEFAGTGKHNPSDPGSVAIRGKTMIVQSTNMGSDVNGGQFDLLIPGGGVGQFNGCADQWGTSDLGQTYGGFLAACSGDYAAKKACLISKCHAIFDAPGREDLLAGCLFHANWMQAADNPNLQYKEVPCPAALTNKSGLGD